MLDGRIDTQGTVDDLRNAGLLETIKQDAVLLASETDTTPNQPATAQGSNVEPPTAEEGKKPRKLVEESILVASSYGCAAVLRICNRMNTERWGK
jgi:hypothetical protein